MIARRVVLHSALWLLLAVCSVPLLLLFVAASDALVPLAPQRIRFADGRTVIGQILSHRGAGAGDGFVRILRGDGTPGPSAVLVASRDIVSRSVERDAWVVEREDGPVLFGIPRELLGPGWRVKAPDSIARFLVDLPPRLRGERKRLVGEIRAARDDSSVFARLGVDWVRWLARDDSTLLLLDVGDGRIVSARISGIAMGWRSGDGGIRLVARRIAGFLSSSPGSWSGGGIRPALISVLSLALMAGFFAGLFGLSAALWIHGRAQGAAWLVRGRALVSNLAGIPGVVWGVAGCGLLVHGLGPFLDRLGGGGSIWGGGGLLWSGITLGALATPIVVAAALEELDKLPRQWMEIFWCSGATKLQIFRRIILPHSWKGLLAAVLSGMARAAGETAPIMLTGAVYAFDGLSSAGNGIFSGLSGGFLHPGMLALDPPWQGFDLENGQPLVASALLLLALFCIVLDLVASGLRHRPVFDREDPA